jgi:hypothetical protein
MIEYMQEGEKKFFTINGESFFVQFNDVKNISVHSENSEHLNKNTIDASFSFITNKKYDFTLCENDNDIFKFPNNKKVQISIYNGLFGIINGKTYVYLSIIDPSNKSEKIYSQKLGQSNSTNEVFVKFFEGQKKEIKLGDICFNVFYYGNIKKDICSEDEDCREGEFVRTLLYFETKDDIFEFVLFSDGENESIFEYPNKNISISISSFGKKNDEIYIVLNIKDINIVHNTLKKDKVKSIYIENPNLNPNPEHGIEYYYNPIYDIVQDGHRA